MWLNMLTSVALHPLIFDITNKPLIFFKFGFLIKSMVDKVQVVLFFKMFFSKVIFLC